jgi:hypothetical protein
VARLSKISNKCRCGVVIPLAFMLTFVCVVIIFLELGTRIGWIRFCKKYHDTRIRSTSGLMSGYHCYLLNHGNHGVKCQSFCNSHVACSKHHDFWPFQYAPSFSFVSSNVDFWDCWVDKYGKHSNNLNFVNILEVWSVAVVGFQRKLVVNHFFLVIRSSCLVQL